MSRNVSDKVINEQGNVATFCAGSDARLIYQTNDGELKKYLIEGEGGGGSDAPSALIQPDLDLKFVDSTYEDYVNTFTISTKRNSSDESIFKLVDLVDNAPVNVITINNIENNGVQQTNLNANANCTINGNEFYVKNGNNYRFMSTNVTKFDGLEGDDYAASDFEIAAKCEENECKLSTDMLHSSSSFSLFMKDARSVGDSQEYWFDRKIEFKLKRTDEGDIVCALVASWDANGGEPGEVVIWQATLSTTGQVSYSTVND